MPSAEPRPLPVLPSTPIELRPGRSVICYSVAHLRTDNVYGRQPPAAVAKALIETGARFPDANAILTALGRRLSRRLGLDVPEALPGRTSSYDAADDRDLVRSAVLIGSGRGLGAAWGTAPDADMLWAGAALLTEHHGADHPEEIAPG